MSFITQKIFLDFSNLSVPEDQLENVNELLGSSIEKVNTAFLGTNIEIVTERPESGEYSRVNPKSS